MNHTIVNTSFIIMGIDKKGEKVYYTVDHSSGGYPYWTSYWSTVEKFTDIAKVTRACSIDGYMAEQAGDIQIMKLEEIVYPFSVTNAKEELIKVAEAQIEEIRLKLKEQISALNFGE